jgi:hypothetical protein
MTMNLLCVNGVVMSSRSLEGYPINSINFSPNLGNKKPVNPPMDAPNKAPGKSEHERRSCKMATKKAASIEAAQGGLRLLFAFVVLVFIPLFLLAFCCREAV